jgi:hypothetical protein
MTIWYIFVHLVHFSGFGIMHQEKSGNPDADDELPLFAVHRFEGSFFTVSKKKLSG